MSSLLLRLFSSAAAVLRRLIFQTLCSSSSPLPRHISFILDGNRRYARILSLPPGDAYRLGFLNAARILRHCADLGIPFVSIFVFSVDNFARTPDEIRFLMSLFRDKLLALLSHLPLLSVAGIRIRFVGDLTLIDPQVRDLCRRVEEATKGNESGVNLLVCLAYSSRYEMVKGVTRACCEGGSVSVGDLEKGMYMGGYPEPDLLVRTSGEWRMSNFLLWQSAACLLYAPACLWPELSLRHLLYALLLYQKAAGYLAEVRNRVWDYDRRFGFHTLKQ